MHVLGFFPAASRGTAGELCTPERQNRTTHRARIARGSPRGTCCHKPWRYMSPTTRLARGSERSQGVLCHKREVTSGTGALAGNESHALGREGSRHRGADDSMPTGSWGARGRRRRLQARGGAPRGPAGTAACGARKERAGSPEGSDRAASQHSCFLPRLLHDHGRAAIGTQPSLRSHHRSMKPLPALPPGPRQPSEPSQPGVPGHLYQPFRVRW